MHELVPPIGSRQLDLDSVLNEARARTDLQDYGDLWFLEPLGHLLDAWRSEADLNEAGIALQRKRTVHSLINRLRLVDAIKRNPEIRDEDVTVAAVIVGLPRTGSTMFHRLLSNAPEINTIRWWETQSYAPFPDEVRGNPEARRRYANGVMEEFVGAGMMSIHPFSIDAPDEEIIIIGQLFVGTGPEAEAYVPSFAAWLSNFNHRPAYEDIKDVLRFFQWQNPDRRGKRWVLKTPGHLPTLQTLFEVFPETQVITTHRDPLDTVPSFCSMVSSLHGMVVDHVDEVQVGRFTAKRWAKFLQRYMEVRSQVGNERFIDIDYKTLLVSPLEQAHLVLRRLGLGQTDNLDASLQVWLEENARDKRAAHQYTLAQFGLTTSELEDDFAQYRARFIL